VVNNLGMKHPVSQQALTHSTYKAFKNDLAEVCKSILVRMPAVNFKDLLAILKKEKLKNEEISSLFEHFFKGDER
jgi:hypothetical protein